MATERLLMRNVREILRAKWELRLSNRKAAKSAGVSAASVVNVLQRASEAGLAQFADVMHLGEAELEVLLYPETSSSGSPFPRAEPDCAWWWPHCASPSRATWTPPSRP